MTVPKSANGFQKVWFEDANGNERELQLSPGARIMGLDFSLEDAVDHTEICVVDHSHPGSFIVVGRFHARPGTIVIQCEAPSDAPSLSQNKHITSREPGTIRHVDKLYGIESLK